MTFEEAYIEAQKRYNKIPNIDKLTYIQQTKVLLKLIEMIADGRDDDRIFVNEYCGVMLNMDEAKAINDKANEWLDVLAYIVSLPEKELKMIFEETCTENLNLPYTVWRYFNKLSVMFGKDPDVEIEIERVDDITFKVMIYVNDSNRPGKADAFTKMLPSRVDFGIHRLYIDIIPNNDSRADHEVLIDMFYGNPIIDSFVTDHSGRHYIIFKKDILQYYANDISDVNSLQSVLAEDLARELITDDITNVYFCTASE